MRIPQLDTVCVYFLFENEPSLSCVIVCRVALSADAGDGWHGLNLAQKAKFDIPRTTNCLLLVIQLLKQI